MAVLFIAEQFAGAANLEIVAGQLEAGAEIGGGFNRLKPLPGIFGHYFRWRRHQIGIGLMVRATDPAAQLMQLGQAELVGAINDNGVGRRNINTGFNNGGTNQHVETAVIKIRHHRFQVALAHLAVGNADPGIRHQLANAIGGAGHGVDIVVQVIDLTAAQQLAQNRFLDQRFVMLLDKGFYRQPALRWRGDNGNLAQAGQRHIQGARNRCGGQGQHVALGAHLLQPFLVAHAEAVFFIDNNQAKIAELDAFLQQLMGADQNIDLAFLETFEGIGFFLATAEPVQHFDANRPVGKAVAESFEMLLGEQGGGHQHRDLGAVLYCGEGGAHGHFGFAETDIAAHQPVHRFGAGHIGQHGFNGLLLVGGFLERKAGSETPVFFSVNFK